MHYSTVKIPEDRTWWHATTIQKFGKILRESLQVGPDGRHKAVYSFESLELCRVYGGTVFFGFTSFGMVTRCKSDTPKIIPEGVIVYLDSNKKNANGFITQTT